MRACAAVGGAAVCHAMTAASARKPRMIAVTVACRRALLTPPSIRRFTVKAAPVMCRFSVEKITQAPTTCWG